MAKAKSTNKTGSKNDTKKDNKGKQKKDTGKKK